MHKRVFQLDDVDKKKTLASQGLSWQRKGVSGIKDVFFKDEEAGDDGVASKRQKYLCKTSAAIPPPASVCKVA